MALLSVGRRDSVRSCVGLGLYKGYARPQRSAHNHPLGPGRANATRRGVMRGRAWGGRTPVELCELRNEDKAGSEEPGQSRRQTRGDPERWRLLGGGLLCAIRWRKNKWKRTHLRKYPPTLPDARMCVWVCSLYGVVFVVGASRRCFRKILALVMTNPVRRRLLIWSIRIH